MLKKVAPHILTAALVVAVFLIVLAYGAFVTGQISFKFIDHRAVEKWGQFGDTFGFLNACFSGLVVVGVVAGFAAQRRQRKREEDAVIAAISTEIRLAWENYQQVSVQIDALAPGSIHHSIDIDVISLFPVFHANAASIGRLEGPVRKLILKALSEQVSMLTIMKTNARITTALRAVEFKVQAYDQSSAPKSDREYINLLIERESLSTQAVFLAERIKDRNVHLRSAMEACIRRLPAE